MRFESLSIEFIAGRLRSAGNSADLPFSAAWQHLRQDLELLPNTFYRAPFSLSRLCKFIRDLKNLFCIVPDKRLSSQVRYTQRSGGSSNSTEILASIVQAVAVLWNVRVAFSNLPRQATSCLARIFRQGPKTPMMVSNSVVARIRVRWPIHTPQLRWFNTWHRSSAVICKGG